MGKKNKKQAKIIAEVQAKEIQDTKVIQKPKAIQQPATIKKSWIRIVLVVVVLLMYGNSVNYEFTIDDNIFYLKHSSVQKGLPGIPETFTHGSLEKYNRMTGLQPYRPVTLSSFALQKQLFQNDPAKAHLVNVLLYVLLVLVLFNCLLKLLPKANPIFCGIIVLLFAAHPVHTEVVASVKSQDELLSVLFGLLALSYAASLVKEEKYSLKNSILSILFFSLALFSKEGAFAMILVFPLAFWLLLSQSIKRSIVYSLPYLAAGMLFLFARHLVLDGQVQNYQNTILENVLFGAKGFAEATATKMEILFHYLRLFFVPWPLSWDYSYNQVPVVDWSSFTAWFSLLSYAGMFTFAILKIKKQPVISFGIFFFLIMLAPTANLFFLNGSTVSERFLFFPSLGLIIAVVYGLAGILKIDLSSFSGAGIKKFNWIFGLVIVVFIGLTISRSGDWKSNLSIFEAGVAHAPNSSRTNVALGNEYYKLGQKETNQQMRMSYFADALTYAKAGLAIYPANKDALYTMGLAYTGMGDKAKAAEYFRNTITYDPKHRAALNNLGTAFFEEKKYDSAYSYFKRCYDADTLFSKSSQNLAIYYFTVGNYNQAIQFAATATRLNKYQLISYDVLSKAYKALGNEAEALNNQRLYREMSAEAKEMNKVIE
jgi:Tfp pilus assembly protein PilF